MMTELQCEVLVKVRDASREGHWFRAEGNGQRVTLASLYRRGLLERRAWRGKEGAADAANEYRITGARFSKWLDAKNEQAYRAVKLRVP